MSSGSLKQPVPKSVPNTQPFDSLIAARLDQLRPAQQPDDWYASPLYTPALDMEHDRAQEMRRCTRRLRDVTRSLSPA